MLSPTWSCVSSNRFCLDCIAIGCRHKLNCAGPVGQRMTRSHFSWTKPDAFASCACPVGQRMARNHFSCNRPYFFCIVRMAVWQRMTCFFVRNVCMPVWQRMTCFFFPATCAGLSGNTWRVFRNVFRSGMQRMSCSHFFATWMCCMYPWMLTYSGRCLDNTCKSIEASAAPPP